MSWSQDNKASYQGPNSPPPQFSPQPQGAYPQQPYPPQHQNSIPNPPYSPQPQTSYPATAFTPQHQNSYPQPQHQGSYPPPGSPGGPPNPNAFVQSPQPQYSPQTQQPGMKPEMSVQNGRNPLNMLNKPYDKPNGRDWSNGICDCFADCGTCFAAWCCPCIVYGQNKTRLEYLQQNGRPHPTGGESCGGDTWIHCLLTCCLGAGWILQIGNRGNTRGRYRIAGDTCSDCMCSCCCHACALTQESRELQLEEGSFRN